MRAAAGRCAAFVVAGTLLVACTVTTEAERAGDQGVARSTATVTDVVDGDTVVITGDVHVRLIGFDTPERDQCGHGQASELLRAAVEGRAVVLVDPSSVTDADRYGRLLRYVEVDGRDAGAMMIEAGLAHARYDGLDGYDPHPLQDLYRELDATHPHVCG